MLTVKTIVMGLFFPVSLCLEILILGLFLLWFTKKQRAGKLVVTIGTIILLLASNAYLTDMMLIPLEQKYPAMVDNKFMESLIQSNKSSPIKIVMLGGGCTIDPQLPITSQIGETSLTRVLEAVRLYKELPGSKLIFSGGNGVGEISEAEILAKIVPIMGVNHQDVILETESINTEDEARLLKPMLRKEKFILVTSASHMPRAMALFQKKGMNPIPAPAGHLVKGRELAEWTFPFPGASDLYKVERAFYEYLGLAWAWLTGKI
ncbi:MAG: envelope biogenesis factor ElyC [Desulfobaccales bacterium]|nr:envelope biogenesis factor ElyC [Desulfobaccales bacterium]